MAYFFRITFLLLLSNLALAGTFPAPTSYIGYQGQSFTTPKAACDSEAISHYNGTTNHIELAGTYYKCYTDSVDNGWVNFYSHNATISSVCPDNTSTIAGSPVMCQDSCVSPQTYNQTTGQCSVPNNCTAGLATASTGTSTIVGSENSTSTCQGGCTYSTGDVLCTTGTQGACYAEIRKQTGASCTSSPTPTLGDSAQAKQDCLAKGSSYGTINGVVSCVPRTNPAAEPTKTTSTSTANSTANGGTTNVSTTTSTTVNTTNNTVTTTKTTTTTNPDGTTSTKTDDKTEPQKTFCDENPTVSICKDSFFNGACDIPICNGDAIQCAIAKRQNQDHCDALDAKDKLTVKSTYLDGEKLVNGTYSDDVTSFLNGTGDTKRTVNVPSSLSEAGQASYSSEGFSDVTISALGRSINLPFSKVNDYFGYFGYILLGLAYLSAYKIVTGAI